MILNEMNLQVHSKTTCKSTRKVKTKGLKEGTKEVKERKGEELLLLQHGSY
jgi:hypothetical protein